VRSNFGLHQSSSAGVGFGMDPVVRYSVYALWMVSLRMLT
jgi:hypothetical protein